MMISMILTVQSATLFQNNENVSHPDHVVESQPSTSRDRSSDSAAPDIAETQPPTSRDHRCKRSLPDIVETQPPTSLTLICILVNW